MLKFNRLSISTRNLYTFNFPERIGEKNNLSTCNYRFFNILFYFWFQFVLNVKLSLTVEKIDW